MRYLTGKKSVLGVHKKKLYFIFESFKHTSARLFSAYFGVAPYATIAVNSNYCVELYTAPFDISDRGKKGMTQLNWYGYSVLSNSGS